jgi:DNA-binding NarL/FixJ family response regulator
MSIAQVIRVMTVDDHPLLREGIAAVLAAESDITLVAEATSGEEALEKYRLFRPDVTLMDLQMPGMNGIEAMVAIRNDFPAACFVILTTYQGDVQALRALKSGASSYLLKSMLRKELLQTIRAVHSGKKRIPPEIAAGLAHHVIDESLTDRELEVLRKVAEGTSNKRIASCLSVSEGTVKSHMKNIMSKLGANDRTHAVTIAIKRGFIED